MELLEALRPRRQSPEELAGERVAFALLENLEKYRLGERASFHAIFPVNFFGVDENGTPNGVNDFAHRKFVDLLAAETTEAEFVILDGGTKLFVQTQCFQVEDEPVAHQITYQSEPFDI